MPIPVAYLRRSRVDAARPGTISYEQQLAAVRTLAAKHGDDPDAMVILEDWGKSGRVEKQAGRSAYARLEAMIAAGEASAVYSYSLSRLARSLEVLSRLTAQCAAASVPIRCADGHSPDVTNATGRMVLSILGAVHQWSAEWTAERAAEGSAIRRTRGDHMGPAPFGSRVAGGQLEGRPSEDPDVVVAAFRAELTYQGTARRLTADGVQTRTGRPWAASTVRGILSRVAPAEVPIQPKRGRPPRRAFRLNGLLRCPCGATLTGRLEKGGTASYGCQRSYQAGHGRPTQIAERALLPWVKAEGDRLSIPADRVIIEDAADPGRRADLEAARRAVLDASMTKPPLIDKAERDRRLLDIADEMSRLVATERTADVPAAIDWTLSAGDLNAILRALWDHVELGPDLLPVSAEWFVPEWRRPD